MSLAINGVNFSRYFTPSATKRLAEKAAGDLRRTDGGDLRLDVLKRRDGWGFRTKPLSVGEALAASAWVEGAGDVITFDSLWTAKGRLFADSDSAVFGTGKYGNGVGLTDSAGYFEFDLPEVLTPSSTLWGWYSRDLSGGDWGHYVRRLGDLATWEDGVSIPSAGFPSAILFDLSYGAIRFTDPTSSGAILFDDWVIFPYSIPDAWAAEIAAEHAARAWSTLPKLRVSGDLLPDLPRSMRGEDLGGRFLPAKAAGTETISFALEDI